MISIAKMFSFSAEGLVDLLVPTAASTQLSEAWQRAQALTLNPSCLALASSVTIQNLSLLPLNERTYSAFFVGEGCD